MATSPGKTMYTKSTNKLPLDYQVIPGLQLSALNFELSWKIVTTGGARTCNKPVMSRSSWEEHKLL